MAITNEHKIGLIMRTIYIIAFSILTIIGGVGVFLGLNPRKWYSWLFGVCGFTSGFIVGLLRADIKGGLGMGVFFGLAVMFGGITIYWQRKRYGWDAAETWLRRFGNDKRFSLLTRLLKQLKK